jgi:hypothetical protein
MGLELPNRVHEVIRAKLNSPDSNDEVFERVVREEIAKISTRIAHESNSGLWTRFLEKHSGAVVTFF